MRFGLRLRALLAVPIVVAALPAVAAAQAIRLELHDAATQRRVASGLVTVIDSTGATVAEAAVEPLESMRMRVPAAGTYRVVIRRIGFLPFRSQPVLVMNGETVRLRIDLRVQPLVLAPVYASARSCGRLDDKEGRAGEQIVLLWEQLRTALKLAALHGERIESLYPVQSYVAHVAADGRTVRRISVRPRRPAPARAFTTYTPAELSARGYVRRGGGQVLFAAPDERVLLSNEFIADHCFRIIRGEGARKGLVGMEFSPARGREVPEIAGVLWADPATAALRTLEFWFVDERLSRQGRGRDRAGGYVHFGTLPDESFSVIAWVL